MHVNNIILYNKDQSMTSKITSSQMRAARALLRWSALDLAKASKVGVATIRRVEVVDGEIPVTHANAAALRQALEAAGVEFIDENGGGPGVRLRKSAKAKLAR
jgi:predicted transcriptional regulator